MTIITRNALKNMGVFSLLITLIASCSNDDINTIDAGFIDNLNFVTKELISEVTFSSEDIPRVQSAVNGQFLLGVYDEPSISKIRGSFVSQLILPNNVYLNDTLRGSDTIVTSKIDDVVLYLPYHATVTSIENGLYTYKLDSIFGIKDTESENNEPYGSFSFEVDELETFLNPLDPTDPSSVNVYYSDKDYQIKTVLSTVVDYSPTASDTATYIDRIDGSIDSISLTNNAPRIAVHLDKSFFQTEILNRLPILGESVDADFQSQESFIRYFKGLYIKTISEDAASIATLPLTDAFVEMYYSNIISSESANYKDTIVKTMHFDLGGVKAVKYESRDQATRDADKLYIQGTSGSQANIKLLGYDDTPGNETVISTELSELRAEANDEDGNLLWLINEANLLFYVNEGFTPTDKVSKLFLYKKVPEINGALPYNSQLLDYITASELSRVDGNLLKDENDAYYYKFKLTDYITQLLKGTNTSNVDNLGLKIYNPGDYPTNDTLIRTSNWNPRGVVLYGGSQVETDDKRTVLKINYSYQNR